LRRQSHDVGHTGEQLAAEFLAGLGWTIVARNYRAGPKEIDLIVSQDDVIAFVEVKTRSTLSGGTPLEPLGWKKRRSVEAAARRWIYEHGRPGSAYRFDAVSVDLTQSPPCIEHIPDAWRVES